MQLHEHRSARRPEPAFQVSFARSAGEIEEAQRLRYSVFSGEMGADLGASGIDCDRFDAYCDHLLVRERGGGEVVGTYRVLGPRGAALAGGYYSEQEFDLGRFAPLRGSLVELGRSCIHPAYRTGAVVAQLWSGLARYIMRHRLEYLMGCASVSLADGGVAASAIYRKAAAGWLSPSEYRVFPCRPLPLREVSDDSRVAIPPLIKGYLRVGAYVCGEPAWDPEFNTADLLIMMPMARVDMRYARHFLTARGG